MDSHDAGGIGGFEAVVEVCAEECREDICYCPCCDRVSVRTLLLSALALTYLAVVAIFWSHPTLSPNLVLLLPLSCLVCVVRGQLFEELILHLLR